MFRTRQYQISRCGILSSKMIRHMTTFCGLALLAMTGCSQAPAPAPDNREADTRALRDGEVAAFVKDWGSKHADKIAAHYTDDGNLILPNTPVIVGKSGIQKAMQEAFSDPNWSLALQSAQVEVSRGGDLGYARGTYVLTATDPASKKPVTERGRFLAVFRKEADGSWKAVQDVTNAEAPAVPAAR
jgi:uncharacterized protein (TIGR02246 family)